MSAETAPGPHPRPVVVLGGLRTPFAPAGTALAGVSAAELGRLPTEELLLRLGVELGEVDEVIFGCSSPGPDGGGIARVIALRSGLPEPVPATTVRRNGASGLEAITCAFDRIRFAQADLVVAGGVESVSGVPARFRGAARKKLDGLARTSTIFERLAALARFRPRDFRPVRPVEGECEDPVCGLEPAEAAERLARDFGISREDQDRFALRSHHRALEAAAEGRLRGEIVPVHPPPSYSAVETDRGPRKGQSMAALHRWRPRCDAGDGTVTEGNTAGPTDGGVALLLASQEKARELEVEPLGTILGYAHVGCPPDRLGLGTAYAIAAALDRAGRALARIDRVEIDEASAAQVLASRAALASPRFSRRELGRDAPVGELDLERLNVNGGEIAFGRPSGASGARLVLTLLRELARSGRRNGLAAVAVEGGQGAAVVVEGAG